MAARTYKYCTADDDVRVLIEKVTDAVVSDTSVNYMIDIACDLIDGKLHYMYTVPFTTTPPVVKTIATHLASYFVLRRIYSKTRGAEGNDWIVTFRDFADELVRGLVDGSITLLDSDGTSLSPKSDYGMKTSTKDYTPIFNDGDELSWEVDEDKVKDSTSGR